LIFSFIRYAQPGWKFNVLPKAKTFSTYLFHPQWLPLPGGFQEPIDERFETEAARYADVGYRAWNRGIMQETTAETAAKIMALPKPSLKDEYRFIFKYWGRHWATYALLRRIFSFHNPFAEITAYSKVSDTVRLNAYGNPVDQNPYHQFDSPLVKAQPKISVIIPTLNRYQYLRDVMLDLEKQDYTNFDVIVVDQSEPFNEAFYKEFKLNMKAFHQKEKLLWTARNRAVRESDADYLLFFDDDSRVEPDWITQHLKSLDFFNAEISAGVSLAVIGAKVPQSYSYFRWADQFDSGNALVKREVFHKIGLFDLQFNKQSMGDGEFGIRAYLNGIHSISNPFGKRIHLKVSDGGLREIGHWDGFRPKKWFAPKPIPSVVYLYKKYFPKHLYHDSILLGIMLSNVGYKNKRKNNMLALSIFLTIVKSPLLLIQFLKSRKKANAMLAEGDKIEVLAT
jgi:GT2 family glycosyltransferase